MESNLNKIFSDFIETTYGELELEFDYDRIHGYNKLFTISCIKDNEKDFFGYFNFIDDNKSYFSFYYDCNKPKLIKGMFGVGWDKLVLKYIKKRFPEFDITKVKW